jgi:hypothetical protein
MRSRKLLERWRDATDTLIVAQTLAYALGDDAALDSYPGLRLEVDRLLAAPAKKRESDLLDEPSQVSHG